MINSKAMLPLYTVLVSLLALDDIKLVATDVSYHQTSNSKYNDRQKTP